MNAQHVLVIEADPIDGDNLTYRVECPAGSDPAAACASWQLCGDEADDDDAAVDLEEQRCSHSPTGEHRWFYEVDAFCAPTTQCFVAGYDDLVDAAVDISHEPGRYPIEWVCEDEVYLRLSPATVPA